MNLLKHTGRDLLKFQLRTFKATCTACNADKFMGFDCFGALQKNVAIPSSYFSIRKSIKTVLHLSLYLLPVFQHLPNSSEKLPKKTRSSHSVFTCVHLPDVHRAVRASHHQVVICWTPLDDLDGEEVSRCQHDALPLPETEQADGVVAGHRADAVLHPSLQRKNSRRQWSSKELQLWNIADRLVEDQLELNLIIDCKSFRCSCQELSWTISDLGVLQCLGVSLVDYLHH